MTTILTVARQTNNAGASAPRTRYHRIIGPLRWRLNVRTERNADAYFRHFKQVERVIVAAAKQAGCAHELPDLFASSDAARAVTGAPLPFDCALMTAVGKKERLQDEAREELLQHNDPAHLDRYIARLRAEIAEKQEALLSAEAQRAGL